MMATTVETVAGGGGVENGLAGSATDARTQGALGGITARQRPDAARPSQQAAGPSNVRLDIRVSGQILASSTASARVAPPS